MNQQSISGQGQGDSGRCWELVGAHGPGLGELCRAGSTLMPGVTGFGLSAGPLGAGRDDDPALRIRFSSDQASARLESAQETLDDGPCRDATTTREPVHAVDLVDPLWRRRWPRFTPAALDAGARAVFALPLHAGGVRHAGAVDLYRRTPGKLVDPDRSAAAAFTAAAVELLNLERLGLDWTGAFAQARLDRTVLALAGGALTTTQPSAPTWATSATLPLARWFDHGSLPALRLHVHTVCVTHGLPDQDARRFVLAMHEAMSNAVQHGGGRGQLLLWQRDGRLWCEISDHGPGIGTTLRSAGGPDARQRAGIRRRRSSGLELIQQACTSLDLTTDGTGTRLRLGYRLGTGRSAL